MHLHVTWPLCLIFVGLWLFALMVCDENYDFDFWVILEVGHHGCLGRGTKGMVMLCLSLCDT